jgi:hypothetical protein
MASIEELSQALVKADAAGNVSDAKAFADAIRQMQAAPTSEIPKPRSLVEWPRTESGALKGSALAGAVETGLQAVTGTIGAAAGGWRGIGKLLTGGTAADATKAIQETQEALTYQPRTERGQQMSAVLAAPVIGAKKVTGAIGEAVGGPLGGAIGEVTPDIAATLMGGRAALGKATTRANALQAQKNEQLVTQSWERAPIIDAAQTANQLGVKLNPVRSNPTTINKATTAIAGNRNLNAALSKDNVTRWNDIAKEDMGLPKQSVLDQAAFDTAKNTAAKPYEVIRKMGTLAPNEAVLGEINSLKAPELIGGKEKAAAINAVVDHAIQQVNSGLNGDLVLKNIRDLRQDAQTIYRSDRPSVIDKAAADARMGIANALENLIESNLRNPKELSDFQTARTQLAKIYDYERATNTATKQLDPNVVAKMLADGKPLTGKLAEIGKVAAIFPEIADVSRKSGKDRAMAFGEARLTRSGPAGSAGFLLGSLVGAPVTGALVGAGLGEIGSSIVGRRIATPGYQASRAVPTDYRPPVNALATTNLPAIYTPPANELYNKYVPNWVPGRNVPEPNIQMGVQNMPPQLPPPSSQATLDMVAQQRAYELARDRAAAARAEQAAQQAATEQRIPAGGGRILDIDPLTGRLRSASEGMKGATPETMTSTGNSLNSAVDKISKGQNFALSAEERIAWDKTRVDLEDIAPGFKKLSEKDVLNKMMDRKWVADTVQKARDKAAAFDEIAKRADNEQALRTAMKNRDEMFDIADALEAKLQAPRPKARGESKAQGPKTRAEIRNKLAPSEDNNRLRIEVVGGGGQQ